jgi:hypothetical protein
METAIAKVSFQHYDIKASKGHEVTAPLATMRELARANLVDWKEGVSQRPPETAGAPSSASPADPASPQTTAKKSGAGKKKTQPTAA